jgi:hypothetical protein
MRAASLQKKLITLVKIENFLQSFILLQTVHLKEEKAEREKGRSKTTFFRGVVFVTLELNFYILHII